MNEKRFRKNVILILVTYAAAITALIIVKINFPDEKSIEYNTLRDLIPLIIAIPAAWLAYSFQRRQSYLKDLRTLYSHLVSATQDAVQYTHLEKPNQSDFGRVQKSLQAVVSVPKVNGNFVGISVMDRVALKGWLVSQKSDVWVRVAWLIGFESFSASSRRARGLQKS